MKLLLLLTLSILSLTQAARFRRAYGITCRGEDDDCCTSDNPCGHGQGDCDDDDQCQGNLVCGEDNCPISGYLFNSGDDCCVTKIEKRKKVKLLRCQDPDFECCTRENPCELGEGDCDYDYQCMPGLRCGTNNCNGDKFGALADCCVLR